MTRSSRWALALVLALLLPILPQAAAAPSVKEPVVTPCIFLDVEIDEAHPLGHYPTNCPNPAVSFSGKFTLGEVGLEEGEGELVLILRPPRVEERPEVDVASLCSQVNQMARQVVQCGQFSTLSENVVPVAPPAWLAPLVELAALVEDAVHADPSVETLPADAGATARNWKEAEVVVRVWFAARWDPADCSRARGAFSASVDDRGVQAQAPPAFFAGLCALSTRARNDASALGPQAAGLAASAAGALAESDVGGTLQPALDAVAAALAALAVPDAPGAPSADEGSEMESTLAAFLAPGSGEAEATDDTNVSILGIHVERTASLVIGDEAASDPTRAGPGDVADRADALRDAPEAGKSTGWTPPDPNAPAPSRSGATPSVRPGSDPASAPVRALASASARSAPPVSEAAVVAAGLVALVAWGLYQRFLRPRALDQPTRAAAYAACRDAPGGATAADVAAKLGIERKSAEYHLVYLTKLGLLQEIRGPGRRRRFAAPAEAKRAQPAEPLPARVIAHVRAHPGVSAPALAEALDVTRTHLDRYLKELLVLGRLESRVDAGVRVLFVAER